MTDRQLETERVKSTVCPLVTPQLLWGIALAVGAIFLSGYFFDYLKRRGLLAARPALFLDLALEGLIFFGLVRLILAFDWVKTAIFLGVYGLYAAYSVYTELKR